MNIRVTQEGGLSILRFSGSFDRGFTKQINKRCLAVSGAFRQIKCNTVERSVPSRASAPAVFEWRLTDGTGPSASITTHLTKGICANVAENVLNQAGSTLHYIYIT